MDALTRRFTRVSGRVEAVFGYPPERWRSLPGFWVGILHPEDRHRVAQAVNRAIRDREPCEIEYRAFASDGAVVRIRDQVRIIADRDGQPRLIQGRMVVHERPSPEEPEPVRHVRRGRRGRGRGDYVVPPVSIYAPREAAARREAPAEPVDEAVPGIAERILAAAGQAVVASDADHRVTYWNPAAEALLGWTASEAIGELDSEMVPARADAQQNAEILAALIHGRSWTAEVDVETRDGRSVPVLVSASAVTMPDGSSGGFVALITDLREVRRGAAHQLHGTTMDAVARVGRAAGRELHSLADRIDAYARVALERPDVVGTAIAEDLAAIRRATDEAAALAFELRDTGRDREANIRPSDLTDLAKQNVPALELLAPTSVRVSTKTEPAPPVWLDPVAISQALLYLAADACDAMPEGGRLEIGVRAEEVFARRSTEIGVPTGHYVTLDIRDTRTVFDPEDIDRWFDPAVSPERHPLRRSAAHGLIRQSGAWTTTEYATDDGNGLIIRVYFRIVRSPGSSVA